MKSYSERLRTRGQGGFTLIELLVVIAILGILAAVVVFAIGNTTDSANSKACKIEFRTIKTAIEAYKGVGVTTAGLTTHAYPPDLQSLTTAGADSSFLQDDPTANWAYTGGTTFTLAPKLNSKCDGVTLP